MAQPWLEIPLADYEGHMDRVGQTGVLAELFAQALRKFNPDSIAVLGAAGGNGFDRLHAMPPRRVVAADLNPGYLRELQQRHGACLPGLEIACGNLDDPAFGFEPVALVYAALVFEYLDVAAALRRIRGWLLPEGRLCVVLQLPGTQAAVSPSPFASLAKLAPVMTLHDPAGFTRLAAQAGFAAGGSEIIATASDKQFLSAWFGLRPQQD